MDSESQEESEACTPFFDYNKLYVLTLLKKQIASKC